jgi:hypothetical protein
MTNSPFWWNENVRDKKDPSLLGSKVVKVTSIESIYTRQFMKNTHRAVRRPVW